MSQNDIYDYLKSQIDRLKVKTLTELLNSDKQYLEANDKQRDAEEDYQNLDLPPKYKIVVNNLLHWTDNCNMEYSTLSYLAGLIDYQNILECLGGGSEKNNKHILEQLYCNEVFGAEQTKELGEVRKLWDYLSE